MGRRSVVDAIDVKEEDVDIAAASAAISSKPPPLRDVVQIQRRDEHIAWDGVCMVRCLYGAAADGGRGERGRGR